MTEIAPTDTVIDFPQGALPYATFSQADGRPRLGVGIGTTIADLAAAATGGVLTSINPTLLASGRLDGLLAAGRPAWAALRAELEQQEAAGALDPFRVPQSEVNLHLAWTVADYVDFYSSRYHAENVGRMFRPDIDPLLPNWLHMPVGYHGRSGTVVVDGTSVRRPAGQRQTPAGDVAFGPSVRLDLELEVGFVVGGSSGRGEPVAISRAADHLFGVVLLNDWSARDIQAWEYVPLGPFLGKSFATSVSAWVLPVEALTQARVPGPVQADPEPFPYLQPDQPWALDLDLEIWLRPHGAPEPVRIAAVNAAEGLYWNSAQQLAHMTVNGASIRPGDLFGSGTVSGPERGQWGSLLELTWSGRDPLDVGGQTRTFLEDGDEVTLTGSLPGPSGRIPLGPVRGRIEPN